MAHLLAPLSQHPFLELTFSPLVTWFEWELLCYFRPNPQSPTLPVMLMSPGFNHVILTSYWVNHVMITSWLWLNTPRVSLRPEQTDSESFPGVVVLFPN